METVDMKALILFAFLAATIIATGAEPPQSTPIKLNDFKLPDTVLDAFITKETTTVLITLSLGGKPQAADKIQAWLLVANGTCWAQKSKIPMSTSNLGIDSVSLVFMFSKQAADEPIGLVLRVNGELYSKAL
jgi:hypothetical protein